MSRFIIRPVTAVPPANASVAWADDVAQAIRLRRQLEKVTSISWTITEQSDQTPPAAGE